MQLGGQGGGADFLFHFSLSAAQPELGGRGHEVRLSEGELLLYSSAQNRTGLRPARSTSRELVQVYFDSVPLA